MLHMWRFKLEVRSVCDQISVDSNNTRHNLDMLMLGVKGAKVVPHSTSGHSRQH